MVCCRDGGLLISGVVSVQSQSPVFSNLFLHRSPGKKSKILAAHRYIISVNALAAIAWVSGVASLFVGLDQWRFLPVVWLCNHFKSGLLTEALRSFVTATVISG